MSVWASIRWLAALLLPPILATAPSFAQAPAAGVVLPREAGGPDPALGAAAAKLDLAYGAYQRGQFAVALKEALLRLRSNAKDAVAMTLIGEIYRDGYAVAASDAQAAHWYRLASALGDRNAQFALGQLLLHGAQGLEADRGGAKAEFEKAAAQGHARALYNLGVLAVEGQAGGPPDVGQAAKYFLRAAQADDNDAAYSYGILLREGRGVDLDIGEAAHWLKRAADGGVIAAQVEYGIMLFNGVGVERDEAAAARLLSKAAGLSNPIAQNRLAHLYLSGRGVARDLVRAAVWHQFAKAAGHEDAELDAALAHLNDNEQREVNRLMRLQAEF